MASPTRRGPAGSKRIRVPRLRREGRGDAERLPDVGNSSESLMGALPAPSNASQDFVPFPRSLGPSVVQGPLLTVREAASYLRVCSDSVYRLCARGIIAHVRVSNAIRIPAAALRELAVCGGRDDRR